MRSNRTCSSMDTSPLVDAAPGLPIAPYPNHSFTSFSFPPPPHMPNPQSLSLFDMPLMPPPMMPPSTHNSSMPSLTYMPTTSYNPTPSHMPSNFVAANNFPQFSDSFNFSINNFFPLHAPMSNGARSYDHSSNMTLRLIPTSLAPTTSNTSTATNSVPIISALSFPVPFSSDFQPQLPPNVYSICLQSQPSVTPSLNPHSASISAPTPRYPSLVHSPLPSLA
ncbi:hypothetical protein PTI98_008964 [Pleurotus ostreatus]|nr:hypothetical protein PTI98_008964 [Pleurotus ostreatus]